MMHSQIDREEIIERYVLGQLAPEERQAFEEHFFSCDQCFEKVQDVERLRAGVRDAAGHGLLNNDGVEHEAKAEHTMWFRWAFGATACITVALALVIDWMQTIEKPSLHQKLSSMVEQLDRERRARSDLEQRIASADSPEPNVPLVMLQSIRDAEAAPNEAVIPPGARHLALWVELPSQASGTFRLEIQTWDGRPVQTLQGLTRNRYGALAASLPAEALPSGNYRVKLSRQEPAPGTLLAEYQLNIRRK
jgi:hypothetical protein